MKWYNRKGNKEDPWISLSDHDQATNNDEILYGGDGYGGNHARVLNKHRGANVFIRLAPENKGEDNILIGIINRYQDSMMNT